MPAPVEQENVQVLFEFAYRIGDGGRHTVELDCGRGKAATTVDRVENQESLKRQRHVQII